MIELDNVSKIFDSVTAVEHLSLSIEAGEIVGLLGPNGAGKTTTMRMMAGVIPPTEGLIKVDGKRFETHEHTLKERIGYLPENNPLYDELTVEEHLKFWGRLKGLDGRSLDEAIDFAVESTGIAEVYYRFIGELSKGYRQRTGLAQAILGSPDILLLDEPTEGLDPNQRNDIQKLLSNLQKDRTVIISSHVLSEIGRLADRIVIIHHGTVVSDDSPENLVRGSDGERVIAAEIRGSYVKKTLGVFDEVISVTREKGTDNYLISVKADDDFRETLFDTAVEHGWKILSLSYADKELEDVFAELTKEVL